MPTSQSKQALREYRRRQGLCIHCGALAIDGQTRCKLCAEKDKNNRARIAARKKTEGRCIYLGCEASAENLHPYCQKHRLAQNASARKLHRQRRIKGLCVDCGKPATNGQRCAPHAAVEAKKMKVFRAKRLAAGLCVCGDAILNGLTLCDACLLKAKERQKQLKLLVCNAYGGPVCVGCAENELMVLQIDHIDGGGHAHALRIGNGNCAKGRSKIYRWLRDNKFPPGFRVLCANCNLRAAYGLPFPGDHDIAAGCVHTNDPSPPAATN